MIKASPIATPILFSLLLHLSGCTAAPAPPAGPRPAQAVGFITAVGRGMAAYYHSNNEPVAMICMDFASSSTGTSGNAGGPPWVVMSDGFVSGPDNLKVTWSLEQHGDQKLKFLLNDEEYDLSKGRLFLIRTAEGSMTIEQLVEEDLATVRADQQGLLEFAKKKPAIAKLFQLPEG